MYNNEYDDVYEPSYKDLHPCRDCEDLVDELRRAKFHMNQIVNYLYGKDSLDMELLEDNLIEVCSILKVNMPQTAKLNVDRPKSEIFNFAIDLMRLQA